MNVIDNMIVELLEMERQAAPILEGWRDLLRLNIAEEEHARVSQWEDRYRIVVDVISEAHAVLTKLRELGYPNLPRFALSRPLHDRLVGQRDTIDAALGQIEVEEVAATATVTFSEPEPKSD